MSGASRGAGTERALAPRRAPGGTRPGPVRTAAALLGIAAFAPAVAAAGGGSSPDASRPGVAALPAGHPYLDGPPPGHTGGFGEATCRACHFDRPLNPDGGEVRLDGVPDRWAADSVYVVTVVLSHGEMRRAGFQLAARWRDGRRAGCSAGALEPTTGRAEAVAGADSSAADGGCEVVYVQHTEEGAGPVEGGAARWRVRWRAPDGDGAAGPVAFHVAANAANDDASEFGDRIYAAEAVSRPAE